MSGLPEEMRERVKNILCDYFSIDPPTSFEESVGKIVALLGEIVQETEKAYGGCHNCYGKGYASVNETWRWRDRVGGDNNAMKFCTCGRGKDLEKRFNRKVEKEASMKITLVETCYACPEQYDAFDEKGNRVAYLRLRHGRFTVDAPYVGGTQIYNAAPKGDGRFEDSERHHYLEAAKRAITHHYKEGTA